MAKQIYTDRRPSRYYGYQHLSLPTAAGRKRVSRPSRPGPAATPVPPRASAFPPTVLEARARAARGNPVRSTEDESTSRPMPRRASALRVHSSTPERAPRRFTPPAPIDEITTQPPQLSPRMIAQPSAGQPTDLAEIATRPPVALRASRAGISLHTLFPDSYKALPDPSELPTTPLPSTLSDDLSPAQTIPIQQDTIRSRSYKLPAVSEVPMMQPVADRRRKRHAGFHPLDHLRWWLVRPGHIEFLCWLGATLLLLGFTAIVVFAFALNLGHANVGH